MAKYNEILVARYNRAIQKLLGMKGEASVPQLSPELAFAFLLYYGVENRYLEQWNKFGVATVVIPGAALFATWRLRNPIGSNVIAVLEYCSFTDDGGVDNDFTFEYGQGGGNLTTLPLARVLDGRAQGGSGVALRPNCIPSSDSLAATQIGTTVITGSVTQALTFVYPSNEDQEIVLSPGDTWQVQGGRANSQCACSLIWRERFLEESERA